eukprot:jgi/Astpho2/7914/Aster-06392
MFRNQARPFHVHAQSRFRKVLQYDQDVVTWSPQGRIHQIEYAMEAVKQGSAAVGLKSKTHVVLGTLRRSPEELSSHQRKVYKVDDHLGTAVSGLNSDGRSLVRYMRNETLNHRFVYESEMPVGRLVRQIADKAQVCTQRSWTRPYGVGLLVAGHDKSGAKLFYSCPSGNFYEYKAMAIGSRSQGLLSHHNASGCCFGCCRVLCSRGVCSESSTLAKRSAARLQAAKTYLERKFEGFESSSLDELIRHALQALAASITDGELTASSCTVAIVGSDVPFTILDDEDLEPHVAIIKDQEDGGAGKWASSRW